MVLCRSSTCRGVLAGEVHGPLADESVFRKVRLDREIGTLVWPNGADFDPETLHDWPQHREELKRTAARWVTEAQLRDCQEITD
jgi:hypothetical protein